MSSINLRGHRFGPGDYQKCSDGQNTLIYARRQTRSAAIWHQVHCAGSCSCSAEWLKMLRRCPGGPSRGALQGLTGPTAGTDAVHALGEQRI